MKLERLGSLGVLAVQSVSAVWFAACSIDQRQFEADTAELEADASASPDNPERPSNRSEGAGDPTSNPPPSSPGSSARECTPDATQCLSNVRFRGCSAGVWSEAADCANACVGDACSGDCRPGLTRCASESSVQTCSDQGEWGAATACMNACVNDACTGVCAPSATRCFSETEKQTCNEQGQWLEREPCEFACVDGVCTGECVPGSRRCAPASGLPQFCSSTGAWQTQEPCPFVCTPSGVCGGECTPGSRRCAPTTAVPQLCGITGTWQDQAACPSYQFCAGAGACRDCNTDQDCFSFSCDCLCSAGPAGSPAATCTVEPRNCGIAIPPSCTLAPVCADGTCVLR
jgi:hypothetical protein